MSSPRDARPATIADITAIATTILDELPEPFKSHIADVPVRVDDWPSDAMLDDLGIDDPLSLSGLYCGIPIGERQSAGLPPSEPEMIFLFRMPILFEWCGRQVSLFEVVFDVLTHEIGHHFGMSEEEVLRMEGRRP